MVETVADMTWFERGRRALEALEQARYGDREALFDQMAKSLGVSAQTLRRDTASVRFLLNDFSSQADLGSRLRDVPMAAVEYVARWHRHDPEAALAAARRVAEGELSVRGIELAEKAARDKAKPGGQGRRPREQVFREAIAASLEAIHGKVEPYASAGFSVPYDFTWWMVEPTVHPSMTIIVMGPYSDQSRYSARRVDYCLRADWHNRHRSTILIMADPSQLEFYEAFRNSSQLDFQLFASETGSFTLASGQSFQNLRHGSWHEAIVPFPSR